MRLAPASRRRPQVNITSLIDVLFLMLTFFLVTTSFVEQSALKVELPSMQHADQVPRDRQFVLDVASGGRMQYNGQDVTQAALHDRLAEAAPKINAGGGLMLRADRSLPYGEVMTILDAIRGAGINRFKIATVDAGK